MPPRLTRSLTHPGRHDLAAQRMTGQPVAELGDQRLREVAPQRAGEPRVVGQLGGEHRRGQRDLRVRRQHRELARGQARSRPTRAARSRPAAAGTRARGRARRAPRGALMNRPCTESMRRRLRPSVAEQHVLLVVVPQHERGRPRRSSRPAARCGRSAASAPSRTAWSSRILMLTSWSEVSTPALLSMASVLICPPASANSIRPSWVSPRLPPSPTTCARRSAPSTRIASFALSPTSACGLGARP